MVGTAASISLFSNHYDFKVHNPSCKGSDWLKLAVPNSSETIPAGTKKLVGALGIPGMLESAHWGWLYFSALSKNSTQVQFEMQLFIAINHGYLPDFWAAAGIYDPKSTFSLGLFENISTAKMKKHINAAMPSGLFEAGYYDSLSNSMSGVSGNSGTVFVNSKPPSGKSIVLSFNI